MRKLIFASKCQNECDVPLLLPLALFFDDVKAEVIVRVFLLYSVFYGIYELNGNNIRSVKMQKIWQQAKRIIIFLSLWAIVTVLTTSAVFALFNYFANDEQKILFTNSNLEAYLSDLSFVSFLILYILGVPLLRKYIKNNWLFTLACVAAYLLIFIILFLI